MVNLSLPFAQALNELGIENNKEVEYLDAIYLIEQVFETNPELKDVLNHPGVSAARKKELIDSIFSQIGDQTFQDFLTIVHAHHMDGHLPEISREYEKLYYKNHSIEEVWVTSAVGMTKEQERRLAAALEKKLNARVRIYVQVDPSVIAGLKIQTAHAVLDASYAGKLAHLKEQLDRLG